jgi:hypothetical protein
MNYRAFALGFLAILLSGCGPRAVWVKPGASQQDFTTDRYSCERDTRQSGYFGTGLIGAINMQHFFDSCMNAHGWYLQQQAPVAAASAPAAASATADGPANYNGATDQAVCSQALDETHEAWDTRPRFAGAVAAARNRGLTIERCDAVLAGHSSSDAGMKGLSDDGLCREAALGSQGGMAQLHANVVREAERRGFDLARCNVVQASSPTPHAPTRDEPVVVSPSHSGGETIALQRVNGVYCVPVLVNGRIALNFIIDSGASDVSALPGSFDSR